MTSLRRLIERHPLPAFFVAAYALNWWSAPFARGSLLPHGPFIAALLVLGIVEGREGLRALAGRLQKWRVGWWWYAVAPGLVLAYLLAALAVLLLLGVRLAGNPGTWSADALRSRLLPLLLVGGMWEEPGWSGFALPKLQERHAGRRFGALRASLVLGALQAGWHTPGPPVRGVRLHPVLPSLHRLCLAAGDPPGSAGRVEHRHPLPQGGLR